MTRLRPRVIQTTTRKKKKKNQQQYKNKKTVKIAHFFSARLTLLIFSFVERFFLEPLCWIAWKAVFCFQMNANRIHLGEKSLLNARTKHDYEYFWKICCFFFRCFYIRFINKSLLKKSNIIFTQLHIHLKWIWLMDEKRTRRKSTPLQKKEKKTHTIFKWKKDPNHH